LLQEVQAVCEHSYGKPKKSHQITEDAWVWVRQCRHCKHFHNYHTSDPKGKEKENA
jgi:hypothetical protein